MKSTTHTSSKHSEVDSLKLVLAAGLYPFLHYYNGNFDMADSWLQLGFLLAICFLLPAVLLLLTRFIFKLSILRPLEKYRKTGVNLVVFFGLLAMLIFLGNKKEIAVVMFGGGMLSFLVYRYLDKIVILQLVLGVLSVFLLVPRLWFMATYTADWTTISTDLNEVQLKHTPNIYVIQPDGYANFSKLDQPPYSFDNSQFESYLEAQNFQPYPEFRSNYYSTLTSNSSMFAMKHHYYENTYKGNLKTYGSQDVVVGPYNNTLNILDKNGYTTHFITDNSYFLINGKQTNFDHCNIERSQIKIYDTGPVYGADIVPDFEAAIAEMPNGPNFFFIEKTLPSHVMYEASYSDGAVEERTKYLERLQTANQWLTDLIEVINTYDSNPMIVLVADHGGYVGLDYVKQVERKALSDADKISIFNSLLTIKWPKEIEDRPKVIKSSVNLFRTVFATLGENPELMRSEEPNTSFIPKYDRFLGASIYKCIDEEYTPTLEKIE